jgi:hypothetical protein
LGRVASVRPARPAQWPGPVGLIKGKDHKGFDFQI